MHQGQQKDPFITVNGRQFLDLKNTFAFVSAKQSDFPRSDHAKAIALQNGSSPTTDQHKALGPQWLSFLFYSPHIVVPIPSTLSCWLIVHMA